MHDADDRDLGPRFAALRREVEARVPPFRVPRTRPRRRSTVPAWAAAAAVALVIGGALWLLEGRGSQPALARELLASARWVAPTDFLLDTPGRALLREVPGFNRWRNES